MTVGPPSPLAHPPPHFSGCQREIQRLLRAGGRGAALASTVSLFPALNQLGNVQVCCYVIFTSSSLRFEVEPVWLVHFSWDWAAGFKMSICCNKWRWSVSDNSFIWLLLFFPFFNTSWQKTVNLVFNLFKNELHINKQAVSPWFSASLK